ncbi:MAG: leucyl/phenylalanyl-tRNA--protein transferase [Betaproteobacteria bacterium]|nr:leucyl/phenylalanyl-tRNA--protein transferase [Betaproteobacteria bacterium]NBY05679.1 leucyl/phenylalanyl-tRNA--protein transferase [Betaproteobacteria bacterium]
MHSPRFPIPVIGLDEPLPLAAQALGSETPWDGLVAAGSDMSAKRLIEAYTKGIFPWYSQDQMVLWWSMNPRMVLQPSHFKFHRSLKKALKKALLKNQLEIRVDHDFEAVVDMCAQQKRPGQDGTWIQPEMLSAYAQLHLMGYAHSVETWIEGQLAGGLYCVSIGQAVFGESMFSRETNASKFALTALVSFCHYNGIGAIDCQQQTHHLASLGAAPVARDLFLKDLATAIEKPAPKWELLPVYWSHFLTTSQHLT